MFDIEAMMKLIVTFGMGAVVVLVVAFGVKALFFRRIPKSVDEDQLAGLDERLLRTEAKLNELEERLDFTERMLTEVRGKAQLPGKP